ncbi:MAG: trigger factor, partial [Bacteroidales bacterium]|nr:trigger factor [Bacteroidales bacterium]
DEEYAKMLPDLKWQLIKEQIVKDAEIKVEKADIEEMAKKATKMQFAQYGMANVPEDLLQKYADDMLKDKKIVNNMLDRVMEEKIVEVIKSKVTLDTKEVTLDDFYKSLEVK